MTRTTAELQREAEHLSELLDGLVRMANRLHAAGEHADALPAHVDRLLRALGTDADAVSAEARSYAASLRDLQTALTRVSDVALEMLGAIEARSRALDTEARGLGA